ncbi:hypothetical protein JST97_15795 [bacterium]|nr:hypothetical protein [bacterium]
MGNITTVQNAPVQSAAAAANGVPDSPAWLNSGKGVSGRISSAFADARRLVNPNYLSQDEQRGRQSSIHSAAETLRNGGKVSMTLDEARKLEQYASTTGDAELKREADFLCRMLTRYRPSEDTQPAPSKPQPGAGRLPFEGGNQRASSDTGCRIRAREQFPELKGEALRDAIDRSGMCG